MKNQNLKIKTVRFDNADSLLVGTQELPAEHVYADIESPDPSENVQLDVWRCWGGGGSYQWCGCYVTSHGGFANGSSYRVIKGEDVLEKYETLAAAAKSRYKEFFKALSKMAEAKHKERKHMRRYRLFQVKALAKNETIMPNGHRCCDVLSAAIGGDVDSILSLASSYEVGVRSCKLPKRPKESLGWYLRGAVCGSRVAMQKVVDTLRSGAAEVLDASLAEYWESELAHLDSEIAS